MPSRQAHEYIFQAGLARGQMLQLSSLPVNRLEQRGNRQVRLLHVQGDEAIVFTNRLDAGQRSPDLVRRRQHDAPFEPLTENSTT